MSFWRPCSTTLIYGPLRAGAVTLLLQPLTLLFPLGFLSLLLSTVPPRCIRKTKCWQRQLSE